MLKSPLSLLMRRNLRCMLSNVPQPRRLRGSEYMGYISVNLLRVCCAAGALGDIPGAR